MERYTLQQRAEIIKIHYKNAENLAGTVRKTKTILGRREAPCRSAIQKLVEKFELLGQVSNVKNKTRARRSRTTENIAAVAQSVEENPGLSILRRSLELGIPQTSLHCILHKDLGFKAYKVQLTQELKPADHQQRRVFADWVLAMHENDLEFHRKIIWTDEAHFHLFLWGHVKDKVYANSPALIQDLKDGIREAIEGIQQPLCDLVMKNFMKRIWSCKRSAVVVIWLIFFPLLMAYLPLYIEINIRSFISENAVFL